MGKRETNHKGREEAVVKAAHDLFRNHNYDEVTTSQLAAAAGLSTGTFFRHAGSKSELFIRAYTQVLEQCIAGELALPATATARERAIALIDPIITATEENPANMVVFQREVVFGGGYNQPWGPYRTRAITLIQEIGRRLVAITGDPVIAQAIYASMYMPLVRVTTRSLTPGQMRAAVYRQIDHELGHVSGDIEKPAGSA